MSQSRRKTSKADSVDAVHHLCSDSFIKPQGAPRGLLLYYILNRISITPSHGYEILQDIENKTGGAWRPGAGSIYPILKKLEHDHLIKSATSAKMESRRVYQITPEGTRYLQSAKQMFARYGERWHAMRALFVDLIGPEYIERFFTDGSKKQFQFAQDILKSNMNNIEPVEIVYILKEYALNLERQLNWTKQMLYELDAKKATTGVAAVNNNRNVVESR